MPFITGQSKGIMPGESAVLGDDGFDNGAEEADEVLVDDGFDDGAEETDEVLVDDGFDDGAEEADEVLVDDMDVDGVEGGVEDEVSCDCNTGREVEEGAAELNIGVLEHFAPVAGWWLWPPYIPFGGVFGPFYSTNYASHDDTD